MISLDAMSTNEEETIPPLKEIGDIHQPNNQSFPGLLERLANLSTINEIFQYRQEIAEFAWNHPSEDPILFIPQVPPSQGKKEWTMGTQNRETIDRDSVPSPEASDQPNIGNQLTINIPSGTYVIAGSAAVHAIAQAFFHVTWKNSDTDMFFLQSPKHFRFQNGNTDIVYNPAKTVEELLSNFDLPCCRAGFHPLIGTWISIQCLTSIMEGIYYLPNYTRSFRSFCEMIRLHRRVDRLADPEKYLFNRFHQRIKKYRERGFSPVWIETDVVLPWIKNRFHYGEWRTEEEINTKIEEMKTWNHVRHHQNRNHSHSSHSSHQNRHLHDHNHNHRQQHNGHLQNRNGCLQNHSSRQFDRRSSSNRSEKERSYERKKSKATH